MSDRKAARQTGISLDYFQKLVAGHRPERPLADLAFGADLGGNVQMGADIVPSRVDADVEYAIAGVVPAIKLARQKLLVDRTADFLQSSTPECQLGHSHVVHDAALCASLHALFADNPTGEMRSPTGQLLGHLVLAGGTSLAMCYQLTDRFSEDLDLLFVPLPNVALSEAERHELKLEPMMRIAEVLDCSLEQRRVGSMPRSGDPYFVYSGDVMYQQHSGCQVDVCVRDEYGDAPHLLDVTPATAMSLIGHQASAEQLAANPQWGGFTVPCVGLAYTAATKYDAQHARSTWGVPRAMAKLSTRGRDMIDLYRLANSSHAESIRAAIPEVAKRVQMDFNNQGNFPRPPRGYGHSQAFNTAGDAYQEILTGVNQARVTSYRVLPSSEQVIEDARSLDR